MLQPRRAVRTLPPHYHLWGTLQPLKDRRMALIVNVLGLVLFFLFGWLFSAAAFQLRPQDAAPGLSFEISSVTGALLALLALLGISAVMIFLHEGVHGAFFWWFCRARPQFGFRGYYAFASAPGWYFPKWQYLCVCLAPLLVLTAAGLALLPIVPPGWLLGLLIFLTLNASGAVGDLVIAAWVLRAPSACLALDLEDSTSLYLPEEPA